MIKKDENLGTPRQPSHPSDGGLNVRNVVLHCARQNTDSLIYLMSTKLYLLLKLVVYKFVRYLDIVYYLKIKFQVDITHLGLFKHMFSDLPEETTLNTYLNLPGTLLHHRGNLLGCFGQIEIVLCVTEV